MSGLFNEEFVVVDLETTGLSPYEGCEIIEIGVTEINNGEIVRNYSRLIKPKGIIPYKITNITNITNEMVKDAKVLEEVIYNFRKYMGSRTMIAHNAKFDISFLNYYLEKYDLEPITNYICTLEMLKKTKTYKGKNKKLSTACEYYEIVNQNAHRADSDTLATAQLFLKLRQEK